MPTWFIALAEKEKKNSQKKEPPSKNKKTPLKNVCPEIGNIALTT
jgi:hypothetical protein